ncbi:MAG TPA: glycosyltransferase family 39 protein [Candidatus Limnocylindrales bacterium]|nr:glycosyltransferase family 39 protein [Candidatus Limnocylindrales bacterium]
MAARLGSARPAHPARVVLALFLASLAVRLVVFALTPFPAYPDAEYYTSVARQIAAGQGAVVPYVWAFVDVGGAVPAAASLPIPAFGHWMPLASFVQVPFLWLLGPTDLAAALPFLLLSALLAPFTYLLGRDLLPDHPATGLAGALAVVPAASGYLSQPDNYALYGLLGAGALWLTARAISGRSGRPVGALFVAGLLAGLGFLARTDGFLLAGAIGLSVISTRRRARGLGGLLAAAIGCLVLVVPWESRNLAVFGTFSESAASGRVLFIRDFAEHFGADGRLTIDHLLSRGLPALLWSRVVALASFAAMAVAGLLAAVQLPPALAGAWSLRRRAQLAPFAWWGLLFALWSILVVPAPFITTGNFMHSALVLLPLACLCAALGIEDLVRWLGARRSWSVGSLPGRTRFWGRALVLLTFVAALVSTLDQAVGWNASHALARQASTWLEVHAAPGTRVMSVDPGALYLAGGWPGVQTPASPLPTIERAAEAYGVRYLVLQSDSVVAALQPVLRADTRPSWLGPAVFSVPAASAADGADTSDTSDGSDGSDGRGAGGESQDTQAPPRLAIYPVLGP